MEYLVVENKLLIGEHLNLFVCILKEIKKYFKPDDDIHLNPCDNLSVLDTVIAVIDMGDYIRNRMFFLCNCRKHFIHINELPKESKDRKFYSTEKSARINHWCNSMIYDFADGVYTETNYLLSSTYVDGGCELTPETEYLSYLISQLFGIMKNAKLLPGISV